MTLWSQSIARSRWPFEPRYASCHTALHHSCACSLESGPSHNITRPSFWRAVTIYFGGVRYMLALCIAGIFHERAFTRHPVDICGMSCAKCTETDWQAFSQAENVANEAKQLHDTKACTRAAPFLSTLTGEKPCLLKSRSINSHDIPYDTSCY